MMMVFPSPFGLEISRVETVYEIYTRQKETRAPSCTYVQNYPDYEKIAHTSAKCLDEAQQQLRAALLS